MPRRRLIYILAGRLRILRFDIRMKQTREPRRVPKRVENTEITTVVFKPSQIRR